MDKKITSSVVLASFATTQFGLLNVSAENDDSRGTATNISKEVGEGDKLQSKLSAQVTEKAEAAEDVEKIKKKMGNLERGLDSKSETYSKIVDAPITSIKEKSANPNSADNGAKVEKNASTKTNITNIKMDENKPTKKAVNLNKQALSQGEQVKDISTFGKLKSYLSSLGSVFNFSGKKERKSEVGNSKGKNLKTGKKSSKNSKSPATKMNNTRVKANELKKPEAKAKVETNPQKTPAGVNKAVEVDSKQGKTFGKKASKSSKLFNFAPSKETKMFLGGAGILGGIYAADKLADYLKYGAKKGNAVPKGGAVHSQTNTEVNTDENKSVVPNSEFISDVGSGLKGNIISYPFKFAFVADRKVRQSIGEYLDSFSKDNVSDLLNCKGDGFSNFSKAVKDLNLGSLSAEDLLGKNKKDFLEALKKLSITDKEVDALLEEKNVEKLKNMLQQAGLSAETVEALLGKNLKKFSKRLGSAAFESDSFYAILEKNFGNFEEEVKNASFTTEAIKYLGRLVCSIPYGFLFWPRLTIWLYRKLSESGAGIETKIVAALASIAFLLYKYWYIVRIIKAAYDKYKKDNNLKIWEDVTLDEFRKYLFTDADIQKLFYDVWILRHVFRPLLAGQRNLFENWLYNSFIKDSGEEVERWGDKILTTVGILWRLTPISVGWGLLTDGLPSFLKGAGTLGEKSMDEWENSDLGKQEKEKAEEAEKDKRAKEQATNEQDTKMQKEIEKRLDREDKFLKIFRSDFEELQKKYEGLESSLESAGIELDENFKVKNKAKLNERETTKVRLVSTCFDILSAMEKLFYNGGDKLNRDEKDNLMSYLNDKHVLDGEFLIYIEAKIKSKIPLKLTGRKSEESVERIKKEIQAEEEAKEKEMLVKKMKGKRKKNKFIISNATKNLDKNGVEADFEGYGSADDS